jgi:hypothetical protein
MADLHMPPVDRLTPTEVKLDLDVPKEVLSDIDANVRHQAAMIVGTSGRCVDWNGCE